MIEKQFGTLYGPALKHHEKTVGWPPWLRQPVNPQIAIRCKSLDRRNSRIA
jgi:hypothetical protein